MRLLVLLSEKSEKLPLETLKVEQSLPDSLVGVCIDHTFSTKYFTQDVGIWIDAIDEIEEWVGSFCSEEALQVRQVLFMVIVVVDKHTLPLLEKLKPFADKLRKEHPGLFIAGFNGQELTSDQLDLCDSVGINVLDDQELLDSVYSSIVDYDGEDDKELNDEADEEEEKLVSEQMMEPLLDMDDLMRTLRDARDSDKTDEEKQQLAKELAKQLVP